MAEALAEAVGVAIVVVGVGATFAILLAAGLHQSRSRKHRRISRRARGSGTVVRLTASEAEAPSTVSDSAVDNA